MIKTQYYIVLFFAICSSGKVSTQGRLLTTQYIFNKLSINPAFAGTNQTLDFTVLHRSQWQGIKTAPTHQNISTNFPKIKD
ncbi:MAG TPA: type IX secretion system membrane protein PorP/SprF, partial [Saprospiraceae bacterium]|nr:type IX secretion system membrane protein PorP/SprF [Saprospiraceae bacterium]